MLLGVIFTGKLEFWGSCSFCDDSLLSACVLVKIVVKSGPSNTAVTYYGLYSLYFLVLFTHFQSVEGTSPDSYKNAWMLFLNGLETLIFALQIIPRPNYLTRQMLSFLGLYKDQNTVFIIVYQILSTVVLWSWDTVVMVFPFGVNIICIKSPLFHGVCLSMFSFRWLYIPSAYILLFVHAFSVMLVFVKHK